MKKNFLLIIFLFVSISTFSQVKIGYANLEFILKNLPEAQQMNVEVEKYRSTLNEQIVAKQDYYQSLLEDYYTKQQEGYAESLLNSMREQIIELEQEIQFDANQADIKLAAFTNEKLQPITDKIIAAVNRVYEDMGYTYIFNSADGTGNSIVLKGPEADNLT
ncbi:MAG: OmpH family outer membrane protein, partial [Bacteroidales bacterium]|nr:OmpH family outer membrane protein [Bacteroidales bacterium]